MKLTKDQKLDAERRELEILLDRGMAFDVERTIYQKPAGLFGFLRKKKPVKETLKYTVKELTLSTLDRMAREQIELAIDEKIMKSEAGLSHAKVLTRKHSKRMARIIAIAVMGESYLKQVKAGEGIYYETRDKELSELTEVFFHNISSSRLMQLVVLVNTMGNYGDFCNSIRLMSASRMTMPDLIEKNRKV
jgi:hypothetical protein